MRYTYLLLTLLAALPAAAQYGTTNHPSGYTPDDVRREFIRSWDAYRKYAWGHDVLLPNTGGFSDWYKESLHISPIDAYSTMRVMGLNEQAAGVERYIIDSVSFDKDIFVKTFEVNIRILGGLLNMYQWTHDPAILARAKDFGDRELKAFQSPTGIPYYWVNLRTGAVKGTRVNVAEAGSYLFELGILSYYTRDPRYYQAGKKASRALFTRRSAIGLEGFDIDVETGQWLDTRSFIGACADSYFEYLYKGWRLFHDPELKTMWDTSIKAINRYIPEESDTSLWYGYVDMNTGAKVLPEVTLYDAFFPSILAMDGDLRRAEKLEATWYWLWNRYGLEPGGFNYHTSSITDPGYDLNPEIIESAYYLYTLTGKERYRKMGYTFYKDILQYCRTPIAFSSITDVRTKEQNNQLPTFFFAETMKYLYLLFGGNPAVNVKDYVFNTEAHPFKRADFVPEELRKRLGF
ncbi:glycoside hydrolase family 47 protein [Dinghuibacter silviterrae]|uniref:Mannosidase alpha-like ER degradation enhancer 2 n=1 Tax=Dinghuibacter silviterrae TaxID=1539049 RepID=A0A4R8DU97_9BACT|nr:glycoside hydrolase family 47 protein [Dinghuibacter silviterrae]TDX01934.1 mannosidase alpha-like ER degradation enhancer 2 [Dinghuibacter silviterrae]